MLSTIGGNSIRMCFLILLHIHPRYSSKTTHKVDVTAYFTTYMLVLNIPTNNKADFFKILDFLVGLRINILVVGVRMSNEDMISFYSLNFLTTLNFQGSRFDLISSLQFTNSGWTWLVLTLMYVTHVRTFRYPDLLSLYREIQPY